MMKQLKAWLKARRLRQMWPVEEQLRRLQVAIKADSNNMGHDPKIAALTERYLDMLSPDWYQRSVMDARAFCNSIGGNAGQTAPRPVSREELFRRLAEWHEAAVDYFDDSRPTEPTELNRTRASVQDAVNRLYAALDELQRKA